MSGRFGIINIDAVMCEHERTTDTGLTRPRRRRAEKEQTPPMRHHARFEIVRHAEDEMSRRHVRPLPAAQGCQLFLDLISGEAEGR